jgi:hypothetical protein
MDGLPPLAQQGHDLRCARLGRPFSFAGLWAQREQLWSRVSTKNGAAKDRTSN